MENEVSCFAQLFWIFLVFLFLIHANEFVASRSESACFEDENFICSKEFAAAVKAVAKQMGCGFRGEFTDASTPRRYLLQFSLCSF